ncbi:MAG: hypothetical protein WC595_01420 [Candidatus Nanoarchaeia archaeon]
MINITHLQTRHAERGNAKKLEPYLAKAHVYAPEFAALTEEGALAEETRWRERLSTGGSVAAFEKETRSRFSHLSPDQAEYALAEWVLCFKHKVPVWYLERMSTFQAGRVYELDGKVNSELEQGLQALEKGEIDRFLDFERKSLEYEAKRDKLRDREVGQNLQRAEQQIRMRYSELAAKDPIDFIFGMGKFHKPEKYTSVSMTPVDLAGASRTIVERLDEGLWNERPFDELKILALGYGVLELTKRGVWAFKESQIREMDFETLSREIKRQVRT